MVLVIERTESGAFICGIILTGKTILLAETYSNPPLSTTNRTWTVMRSEAGEFLSHAPRGNLHVGIVYNGHSVRRYFFIGPCANGKVVLTREKDQHKPEPCVCVCVCIYIYIYIYVCVCVCVRPPLWSSGQSFWLQIQRSRVRSPALPDFLSLERGPLSLVSLVRSNEELLEWKK